MRRFVFSVIVASGLVMVGPSLAFADEPAPVVSVKATPGKKGCKVASEKLTEVSGLVATPTGYVMINDSTETEANKKIFFLDAKCKIVDEVSYTGKGPRDPEDLVLSPDGKTLWIADIGDNNYAKDDRRTTVGFWKMAADGSGKPTLNRVRYPEGDNHDAEAMLLNGDGTPLIVTKEIGKPAYIYQPTGPLQPDNEEGVPLKRVGQITMSATETPGNPYARIGNKTVSGGAVASGGGKVALRTYTDALEWDVKDGDVLAALQQKPRITALPNEILGEAITYSADGKSFLTISDLNGEKEPANHILSYTPATSVTAAKSDGGEGDGAAWYADLTLGQITAAVSGIGAIGLILVGIGVLGIVRHRKRLASEPPASADDFDNPLKGDPETELIGVGGGPQRGGPGVYGGAARSGPASGGAARSGPASGGAARSGPASGGGPARPGQSANGAVYGAGGAAAGAATGAAAGGGQRNGVYGGGAAQPARGGSRPGSNGVYGGAPQGGGRPPQGGGQGQRPQQGGQGQRPPQGGQRPQQGGAQGQRPPQSGQRPPQGGQRPPQGGGQRPPQGGGRPPQGGQRPPQGGGRPPQGGGGQGGGPRPGGQPPRPPQGGGQAPRPQGGGQAPRPQGGGQAPRPQSGGQAPRPQSGGQAPRPQGGGQPQRPQGGGGQRPSGVYGQPPAPDARQQRGANFHSRPDGRFDHPGYGYR